MPFLANRPDIAGFEFTFAPPDTHQGFIQAESDFVKRFQALQLGSQSVSDVEREQGEVNLIADSP
jgi:hypothetical protein